MLNVQRLQNSENNRVVIGVLSPPTGTTQHFIGTQLVVFHSLELDSSESFKAGAAAPASHGLASAPIRHISSWGTYTSYVCFSNHTGWQIWRRSL